MSSDFVSIFTSDLEALNHMGSQQNPSMSIPSLWTTTSETCDCQNTPSFAGAQIYSHHSNPKENWKTKDRMKWLTLRSFISLFIPSLGVSSLLCTSPGLSCPVLFAILLISRSEIAPGISLRNTDTRFLDLLDLKYWFLMLSIANGWHHLSNSYTITSSFTTCI